MDLGNKLRRFRFAHGEISQQELANAIGVTRLTIHSIETGKFVPSTLISLKLARFFDVRVEDLFYLADENSTNGPHEMSRESDGDA
jgi:putative transcriptional regulator